MCYMPERDRVGVRELRQNLSVYLRRVEDGEALEVTDRGRPVALLGPLPERMTARERLLVEGRLMGARGDLRTVGPPPRVPVRGSIGEALAEQRDERG